MADLFPLLASVFVSILGGGGLGAYLVNRRLAPKSKAEARSITAAAMTQDWKRFQAEIERLVKRLEQAEDRADAALERARQCEQRETAYQGRIKELEGLALGRGQAMQEAALIVAAERTGAHRA